METHSPSPSSLRKPPHRGVPHYRRIKRSGWTMQTQTPSSPSHEPHGSPQGRSLQQPAPPSQTGCLTMRFVRTSLLSSMLSYGVLLCQILLSPLLISPGHSTQVTQQLSTGSNPSLQGMICTDSFVVRSYTHLGVPLRRRDQWCWLMIRTLVMSILIMSPIFSIWQVLNLVLPIALYRLSPISSRLIATFVTTALATPSLWMLGRYLLLAMASKRALHHLHSGKSGSPTLSNSLSRNLIPLGCSGWGVPPQSVGPAFAR
ncbi:hypothetical protein [Cowpea mottle virus]|uniref:ORF6; Method: conceptual translation supplied by author n=1 Tax=Cowpea mottle virus TaxID=12627 RepID=Q89875_9TOMB|nr:hypothetical protein [Cowpea mottle virus]AAC54607.1 ORF6; Method: conceptual translation supplied by author [Cowpea mottle virus]prf//2123377F ORF 6 [Cowpea mottle virus]